MFGLAEDVRPALRQARQGNSLLVLATLTAVEGGGPRPPGTHGFRRRCGRRLFFRRLRGKRRGRPRSPTWPMASPAPWSMAPAAPGRISACSAARGSRSSWKRSRRTIRPSPPCWTPRLRASPAYGSATAAAAGGPPDQAPTMSAAVSRAYEQPVPRLVVFGSDPTAIAIATLSVHSGFATTWCAPRGRRPRRRFRAWPTAGMNRTRPWRLSAVIAGPRSPSPLTVWNWTRQPWPRPCRLRPAMWACSARAAALPERLAPLRAAGVAEEVLTRVHAPSAWISAARPLGGRSVGDRPDHGAAPRPGAGLRPD